MPNSTQDHAAATPLEGVAAAAAKAPQDITTNEASLATEWFLSEDEQEVAFDTIELNVGGPQGSSKEKWVPFKIQVVDRDEIRRIRQEATAVGRDGTPEVNEMEANLRIAVKGLMDPDLSQPENRKVRGQSYLDPGDALAARFAHKSGLIDQLAGKIVELSGYNDADVREVRAAGN